jgi:hypothetical protein
MEILAFEVAFGFGFGEASDGLHHGVGSRRGIARGRKRTGSIVKRCGQGRGVGLERCIGRDRSAATR